MGDGLEISHQGREVVAVRRSRPPNNGFTVDMCRVLSELLTRPPTGARLLRLCGGEEVFCRGRDRSANGTDAARATGEAVAGATRGLSATSLVSIAEVDGETAGLGVGMVAQCDVSVASSASHLCFPEVSRNLASALVWSRLLRVVGQSNPLWLMATGSALNARGAAARAGQLRRGVGSSVGAEWTR
jgi:enoyl-CoA hydratase/carnithine racemase